jgi:hypothetical protein
MRRLYWKKSVLWFFSQIRGLGIQSETLTKRDDEVGQSSMFEHVLYDESVQTALFRAFDEKAGISFVSIAFVPRRAVRSIGYG